MKRIWLCLPALASLAGCSNVTFTSERLETLQRELSRQYALWQSLAISAYDYQFARECFCPPDLTRPVVVSVTDTTLLSVVYADSGAAVPASSLASYFTVDGLFRQAQVGINLVADSLVLEYDPELHYPTKIVIDQDRLVQEDVLVLLASGLKQR